jgi:hypothetical protein
MLITFFMIDLSFSFRRRAPPALTCFHFIPNGVGLHGKRPRNESDPARAADFASY